ncbi:MAG TPA: methionine gamma-lyase family protein [Candidatus Faecivivens stercoripullorum]|uniref:Methionine gamma-lyase family protein n=1 Tax=Candidatus Faecivivens stercoripullorum TaxID=2840805 RepID=A0A9D1KRR9_9FIRM|nr:methionine gamma-lyase family protein [Candidatus Faecivivens stercoripullorum]
MINDLTQFFDLPADLLHQAEECEQLLQPVFKRIEDIAAYNEAKVLAAFGRHKISAAHLTGSNGYGYDDLGRDTLDKVYADVMGTEDALVRHTFVSGTHALTVALFGVLRTGDRMVAVTGAPYDTLEEVIGLRGEGCGSLRDFGVSYDQVDLLPDGTPDYESIKKAVKGAKLAHIQRSRGYATRPSLTVETIGKIVAAIKEVSPETIVFVDNCYGEFVERQEPSAVGADLMVGSLIKNAGGGIAETGGYIAGRADLVELCGYRLTSPGIGREAGCSLNQNRPMYLGLFYAPSVTASAIKTSVFASALFEKLGYDVSPRYDEPRTDLILQLVLGSREKMCAFCTGIQHGSPIDSHVTPVPWAMPGYNDEVIMAAGAFTLGSSIELSADGPMREPYAVWMQGGLTWNTGKIGVLLAAAECLKEGN